MKKLLLILLIPMIGFGQDCKFSKNEIDDMTGEKNIITNSILLCNEFGGTSLSIQPILINNSFYINLSIGRMGKFDISKGNKVIIKLENDEIVTLVVKYGNSELMTHSNVGRSMDLYHANIEADISLEQLTKLSKSKIKKVRIYYDQGSENLMSGMYYWEKDNFKKRKLDKLITQINCLLSESNKE